MREEVKKFAEEMEKVLKDNNFEDFEGEWLECDITTLCNSLEEEIEVFKELIEAKLVDQIDYYRNAQKYMENIQKKITGVANYCMMIYGKLDTKKQYH
jgi:hypothetical protein